MLFILFGCWCSFVGTLPSTFADAENLAILRLNGNNRIVGTLPDQFTSMHHLALLDLRNTSMQQPKEWVSSPAGPKLTAVPAWLDLVM